jgi:hypothetical protein
MIDCLFALLVGDSVKHLIVQYKVGLEEDAGEIMRN